MIKVIGMLGDIGSGKSFVARQFGYPVFDADKEVSKLYRNNKSCYKKLRNKLPKHIKSYPLNKSELTKAILSNKYNLKKIVSVVHPLLRKKMNLFLRKNSTRKIVVLDIPLLIENKLNKKNDIIIFIHSKKSKVIDRLKKRPNFNEKLIGSLKENQLIISKKKKLADYVINNNFSAHIMKKKVKLIKEEILNERNSSRYWNNRTWS